MAAAAALFCVSFPLLQENEGHDLRLMPLRKVRATAGPPPPAKICGVVVSSKKRCLTKRTSKVGGENRKACATPHTSGGAVCAYRKKKRTLVHRWDARPKRRLYDRGGVLEGERGGRGGDRFLSAGGPRERGGESNNTYKCYMTAEAKGQGSGGSIRAWRMEEEEEEEEDSRMGGEWGK